MDKIALLMVVAFAPSAALACGPSASGMLMISGVALVVFLGLIKSAQIVAKHLLFPLILKSGAFRSRLEWVE